MFFIYSIEIQTLPNYLALPTVMKVSLQAIHNLIDLMEYYGKRKCCLRISYFEYDKMFILFYFLKLFIFIFLRLSS